MLKAEYLCPIVRPFRRNPTKRGVGRALMKVYEPWDTAMATRWEDSGGADYAALGIGCAGAGATVALGAFLTYIEGEYAGKEQAADAELADATEAVRQAVETGLVSPPKTWPQRDQIIGFAESFAKPKAVEACFRVVVWAYLADWATFVRAADARVYDHQMDEFAAIFGVDNDHEAAMRDVGRPFVGAVDDIGREVDREVALAQASLGRMIAASLSKPDVAEGLAVIAHLDAWVSQWQEGRAVVGQRLDEVAPQRDPSG